VSHMILRGGALALLLLAACARRTPDGFPPVWTDTPSPDGADSPCSLGQFGACLSEDECGPAEGHLSSVACGDDTAVCCAGLDRCTGEESFVCCDAEGNEHRPVCDAPAGSTSPPPLACAFGQTPAAAGACTRTDGGECLRSGEFCDPSAPACCPGTQCAPARLAEDGGDPTPPQCVTGG
jgi:hypothetical protein